jgi:hypothetical protein
MLRGARIDLETSYREIERLHGIYVRNLTSQELPDDAIAAINTSIRALSGALDKVATEISRQLGTRNRKPYFPLTDDPSAFSVVLQANLPDLAKTHPKVATAIEKQQPYNEGQTPLRHLKELYRENHHQDFTLQAREEARSLDVTVGGQLVTSAGTKGISIGGAPPWRGIPADPDSGVIDIPRDALPENGHFLFAITTHEDGAVEVRLNGKVVAKRPAPEDGLAGTAWIDWHFVDPNVSVVGTLVPLQSLCEKACSEVWNSTDIVAQ